jgi:hypothetical protein
MVVLAFHWPPSELENLPLEDLTEFSSWAKVALQRG